MRKPKHVWTIVSHLQCMRQRIEFIIYNTALVDKQREVKRIS